MARQKEFPDQVVQAMVMEHLSLSLNVRGQLYSNGSLIDMVKATKNLSAFEAYQNTILQLPWTIYSVRRIFPPKGKGMPQRCVEKSFEYPNREKAEAILKATMAGKIEIEWNIMYAFIEQKTKIPGFEEFKVAAPALVDTKARYGVEKFNQKWLDAKLAFSQGERQLPLLDIA